MDGGSSGDDGGGPSGDDGGTTPTEDGGEDPEDAGEPLPADAGRGEPVAIRLVEAELMDPHLYDDGTGGCDDITALVNLALQGSVDSYDLNFVQLFDPYDPGMASVDSTVYTEADCADDDSCSPGEGMAIGTTVFTQNGAGPCFEADADELNPDYDAPNAPDGLCYVTEARDVTMMLSGVEVPLSDAQLAGRYVSHDPVEIHDGIVTGFLSTEDAQDITFTETTPLVGGDTLYEHLADGKAAGSACEDAADWDEDDSDTADGVEGFRFFLNFAAAEVTWSDA